MLKTLREQKGLTQTELARRARVSQAFVAKIEAGDKVPSLMTLRRLARVLGVSPNHLTLPEGLPMKSVMVVLKDSGHGLRFDNVSRIESKAHRLELYGPDPSEPLADFDKAEITSWYALRPTD